MMEKKIAEIASKASIKNVGIPATKMKLAIDRIRGKDVTYALGILKNTRRAANSSLIDLLNSAVANAVEKKGDIAVDKLKVKKIMANQGRSLKRMRPRAMGRGNVILKRSCHVYVELG